MLYGSPLTSFLPEVSISEGAWLPEQERGAEGFNRHESDLKDSNRWEVRFIFTLMSRWRMKVTSDGVLRCDRLVSVIVTWRLQVRCLCRFCSMLPSLFWWWWWAFCWKCIFLCCFPSLLCGCCSCCDVELTRVCIYVCVCVCVCVWGRSLWSWTSRSVCSFWYECIKAKGSCSESLISYVALWWLILNPSIRLYQVWYWLLVIIETENNDEYFHFLLLYLCRFGWFSVSRLLIAMCCSQILF